MYTNDLSPVPAPFVQNYASASSAADVAAAGSYVPEVNPVIALLTTFIPLIISCIIMGILSHLIARKKGYSGYFWTGFFLSVFGVMYVASLPVSSSIASPLSPSEQRLLDQYRKLNDSGRKEISDLLDSYKR